MVMLTCKIIILKVQNSVKVKIVLILDVTTLCMTLRDW